MNANDPNILVNGTHPANHPRRLFGVDSDAGPDCGVFDVFLSTNFPKIPDILLSLVFYSGLFQRWNLDKHANSVYVTKSFHFFHK